MLSGSTGVGHHFIPGVRYTAFQRLIRDRQPDPNEHVRNRHSHCVRCADDLPPERHREMRRARNVRQAGALLPWTDVPLENFMDVTRAITVGHPRDVVYAFWRDFENLPRFMYHLEFVENLGSGRSHWVAKAPAGRSVEWDAEIVEDVPGERISWRTVNQDNDIAHSGSVSFVTAPGARGTEVHVRLRYDPPGGKIGAAIARLFGEEPGQQIADDLRRFKQVLETGEVVRSEASPDGAGQGIRRQKPAQPSEASSPSRASL